MPPVLHLEIGFQLAFISRDAQRSTFVLLSIISRTSQRSTKVLRWKLSKPTLTSTYSGTTVPTDKPRPISKTSEYQLSKGKKEKGLASIDSE